MPKYQVILQEFTKERYKFTQLPPVVVISATGGRGRAAVEQGELYLFSCKSRVSRITCHTVSTEIF